MLGSKTLTHAHAAISKYQIVFKVGTKQFIFLYFGEAYCYDTAPLALLIYTINNVWQFGPEEPLPSAS
jgi:hypothetical protein